MFRRVSTIAMLFLALAGTLHAAFDPSRFNFGVQWDHFEDWAASHDQAPKGLDYIAIWLTENAQNQVVYNSYWHGKMGKYAKDNGLTQVYIAYIIAKLAKVDAGLNDCDVGGNTLCQKGADYIRNNRDKILSSYSAFAKGLAANMDGSHPAIFLMEPDFIQYASETQSGGGLSYEYLGKLMSDIISAIKSSYPSAKFSMDIAPWINDPGPWYSKLDMSAFSYMNTSGGRTEGGNSRIRMDTDNNVTWNQIYSLTGKPIIADAGYGVGGGCDGSGGSWGQASNISSRKHDGVIALTNACPDDSWLNNLGTLSSAVNGGSPPPPPPPPPTNYTLTLAQGNGGSIAASPSGNSFASGTSVQLTATPAAGYKFVSWGGSASGTTNPTTLVMNEAKTVSATFAAVVDNTPVKLTLSNPANGTIQVSPGMPGEGYKRGTSVTLTASPAQGYQFLSWSGNVRGAGNPLVVTVDSNMTVSCSFRKIGEAGKLIQGGDGSSTSDWTMSAVQGGTSFSTIKDPKNAQNSVFETKGSYGENIADTAFMISQTGFNLVSGTKYYVAFRAMVSVPDATRGAHPLGVRILQGSSVQLLKPGQVEQDTAWHSYSYDFTATASGQGRFDILLGKGGDRNWQSVLLDDIALSDAPIVGVRPRTSFIQSLQVQMGRGSLDFSLPTVEGTLGVEAIAVNGSHRTRLLDTEVLTGNYQATLPLNGLVPGTYVLQVCNGSAVRVAYFSLVE